MVGGRITHRTVDEQRIDGVCRRVFLRRDDGYALTDLVVYADGAVECGGPALIDVERLKQRLHTGDVAATPPDGARVSIVQVAEWRVTDVRAYLDADLLLGDVADDLDRLNRRPDSYRRCLQALRVYLADPSEANRVVLRERYLGIPQHRRRLRLRAMDPRLRILISDIGAACRGDRQERTVTREMHDEALAYLREQQRADQKRQGRPNPALADGPATAQSPPVHIFNARHPHAWPEERGVQGGLYNDFPAAITVNGRMYPTVTHAYWALSTADRQWHDRIAAEPDPQAATGLGHQAPRLDGWLEARMAVMAALLRAKYQQHPQLAHNLLATADARLLANDVNPGYWTGVSNWLGRLLEVVRSELAASQVGIHVDPAHDAGPSVSP
jgi:predicted NAD-dependent protein-ADP-ribosyltransferase YbiA (DUF1768 family)